MRRLLTILLMVGTVPVTGGSAGDDAGLGLAPARACDLLADHRLRTGGPRADGDGFRCRSQRRPLTGGGQPVNTIRYRASGSAETAERLVLELRVNSSSAVQRAHRQLADRARVLFARALGEDLPDDIEAAILSGVTGKWRTGNRRIALERVTAGVPGYELRLVIE